MCNQDRIDIALIQRDAYKKGQKEIIKQLLEILENTQSKTKTELKGELIDLCYRNS